MIRPAGNGYDIGAYEYGSVIDQECEGIQSQQPKRNKKGNVRR
jgi:hypothetical protein